MLFSQIKTKPGEATSLVMPCKYVASPTIAFEQLADNSEHSLLLESAEIDSKDNLKSLMLIDAAVVFECYGHKVIATAKSENGNAVIDYLYSIFKTELYSSDSQEVQATRNEHTLELTFESNGLDTDERARLKQLNAFEVLRAVIKNISHNEEDVFSVFLGGVFAYDMIANFETLPSVPDGFNTCPDYSFYLAETMLVIDHQKKSTDLIGNVFSGDSVYQTCFAIGRRLEHLKSSVNSIEHTEPTPTTYSDVNFDSAVPNISDKNFKETVTNLKNNIIQGDVFQVVPSRGFTLDCSDAMSAYKQLKADNPSPYMFYLKHPSFELFGASPESALKFDAESKNVEVYPIAGTRIRGFDNKGKIDKDLDSRIELDLRNDKKEVSEHIMLVDLARNDVARISKTGSRYVKDFLKVDRYSYVMHLVSRVIGELEDDLDALHAYQACMNMGTLVGAPKIKAAELIRKVEQTRRGSYGGAVGYLNGRGDMDTCIVIRSAFVKDGKAFVQAGAGVVFDSDPESEVNETSNKARAVIKAVLNANRSVNEGEK